MNPAQVATELMRLHLAVPSCSIMGVTVDGDRVRVELLMQADASPVMVHVPVAAPIPSPATSLPKLGKLQRLILSILDRQNFRHADWIAVKLRRPNNGNLRGSLSQLVKLQLLVKGDDHEGYRLS